MPIVSIYHNGGSGGQPGMNNGKAGRRGAVQGWSSAVARRNLKFLWAVDHEHLSGVGYAFTLTVRECPARPEDWAMLVKRWCQAMEKNHCAIRIHWVIEWQKRGVPHLHGSIYFEDPEKNIQDLMTNAWCWIAQNGSSPRGQFIVPIRDVVGWLQYVAKHASRGASHYQRSSDAIPELWKGKTGRMWGKRGDWPVMLPNRFYLDGKHGDGAWFAFRRLVRSWRVADARVAQDWKRLRKAREMFNSSDRRKSEVRGYSEWIPPHVQTLFLLNLTTRGYSVTTEAENVPNPAPSST